MKCFFAQICFTYLATTSKLYSDWLFYLPLTGMSKRLYVPCKKMKVRNFFSKLGVNWSVTAIECVHIQADMFEPG